MFHVNRQNLLYFILFLALLLSACSSQLAPQETMTAEKTSPVDQAMPETGKEKEMMDATPTGEMMAGEGEAMADSPAFYSFTLTDVRSGQAFSIQDYHGKVVLVETMAVWCPTCLRQQKHIQALQDQLGETSDLVLLSLDIDPNEDAAVLKDHVERNQLAWAFAVAPPDAAREIARLLGDQFLNPPSAPMFVIDRQGELHALPFGVKTSEDLLAAIQPFLDQ